LPPARGHLAAPVTLTATHGAAGGIGPHGKRAGGSDRINRRFGQAQTNPSALVRCIRWDRAAWEAWLHGLGGATWAPTRTERSEPAPPPVNGASLGWPEQADSEPEWPGPSEARRSLRKRAQWSIDRGKGKLAGPLVSSWGRSPALPGELPRGASKGKLASPCPGEGDARQPVSRGRGSSPAPLRVQPPSAPCAPVGTRPEDAGDTPVVYYQ
jgi:hypothetical protein